MRLARLGRCHLIPTEFCYRRDPPVHGASASFTPSTISAGDTATMTISPSISTAAGTMPLTVVGTGTSAIQNTSVSLTVNAPTVIRSAFYYPWFPDAWSQQGLNAFSKYVPSRGYYSTDVATVSAQIADLQYAGVTLGIASWFGRVVSDLLWGRVGRAFLLVVRRPRETGPDVQYREALAGNHAGR
jgi:hypothetical protein